MRSIPNDCLKEEQSVSEVEKNHLRVRSVKSALSEASKKLERGKKGLMGLADIHKTSGNHHPLAIIA